MSRIEFLPNLWISSTIAANNKEINMINNISIFINIDNELSNLKFKIDKLYQLSDYEIIKLSNDIAKIIDFIDNKLNLNVGVLLFSNTNPNIGIIIIYAYIYKYGKINKENTLHIIKSKYSQSIEIFNDLLDKII
jgi:hypothetical protein